MAHKQTILKNPELCIRKEGIAGAALTPGDLFEDVGLEGNSVSPAGADAALNVPAIVIENEVVGKGVNDDYATNDTCLFAVCPRGTEVLLNATGAITAGDEVITAVGGVATIGMGVNAVGVALETVAGAGKIRCILY